MGCLVKSLLNNFLTEKSFFRTKLVVWPDQKLICMFGRLVSFKEFFGSKKLIWKGQLYKSFGRAFWKLDFYLSTLLKTANFIK